MLKPSLRNLKSQASNIGRVVARQTVRRVSVRVTEIESGKEIEGATIGLTNKGMNCEAAADHKGESVFEDIEIGRHDISIHAEGYEDISKRITVMMDKVVSVELVPRYMKHVTFITLEKGKPVASCVLDLRGKFDKLRVETSDDGRAQLESIRAGNWQVLASRDHYHPHDLEEEIRRDGQVVNIVMEPVVGERIQLHISDNLTELPIAESRVSLTRRMETFELSSDENGEIEVEGPKEGTYSLTISCEGYTSLEDEFVFEAPRFERTYRLHRLLGDISVRALNGLTKRGIGGLEVILSDTEDLDEKSTGTTDKGGLLELGNHPYGTYSMTLRGKGYEDAALDLVLHGASEEIGAKMHPVITSTPEQLRMLQGARSEIAKKIRELRIGPYDRYLPQFFFNVGVAMILAAVDVSCTPELYSGKLDRQPLASDAAAKIASETITRLSRMMKMPRNIHVYDAAKELPQPDSMTSTSLTDADREELKSVLQNPMDYSASYTQDQADLNDRLEEKMSAEITEMDLYPVKYLQGLSNQMKSLETTNAFEKAFSLFFSLMILKFCFQMIENPAIRARLKAATS